MSQQQLSENAQKYFELNYEALQISCQPSHSGQIEKINQLNKQSRKIRLLLTKEDREALIPYFDSIKDYPQRERERERSLYSQTSSPSYIMALPIKSNLSDLFTPEELKKFTLTLQSISAELKSEKSGENNQPLA